MKTSRDKCEERTPSVREMAWSVLRGWFIGLIVGVILMFACGALARVLAAAGVVLNQNPLVLLAIVIIFAGMLMPSLASLAGLVIAESPGNRFARAAVRLLFLGMTTGCVVLLMPIQNSLTTFSDGSLRFTVNAEAMGGIGGFASGLIALVSAIAATISGGTEATISGGTYDVAITSIVDGNQITAIKAVRDITGLGLSDAKHLVEGTPSILMRGLSKCEAEDIAARLRASGLVVEIKQIIGPNKPSQPIAG